MSIKDNVVFKTWTCKRDYEKRCENLGERIEGILNWYQENPNADPNLYEFIEVAADTAKYVDDNTEYYKFNDTKLLASDLNPEEYKAYRAFKGIYKLGKVVLARLKENKLSDENDALYNLATKAWLSSVNYSNYDPLTALVDKNIAGVGLYIAQLRRKYAKMDEEIEKTGLKEQLTTYNNIKLNQTKYSNEKEYWSLEYLMDLIRTKGDPDYSRERIYSTIQKFHDEPMSFHNYKNFEFPRFIINNEEKGKVKTKEKNKKN